MGSSSSNIILWSSGFITEMNSLHLSPTDIVCCEFLHCKRCFSYQNPKLYNFIEYYTCSYVIVRNQLAVLYSRVFNLVREGNN